MTLAGKLSFFGDAFVPPGGHTSATVVQTGEQSKGILPRQWYDRKVGVRVTTTGSEKTAFYVAPTPTDDPENKPLKSPDGVLELLEVGGTSIIVHRNTPETNIVAMHLPFKNGVIPPLSVVEHETDHRAIVALEVVDSRPRGAREWLLFDLRGEKARREFHTVDLPTKEQFVFRDHGFIQIAGDQVNVWGDVRGLHIKVPGQGVAFRHNGRITPVVLDGDELIYQSRHQ